MKYDPIEVFVCPHCGIPTQSNKVIGQHAYDEMEEGTVKEKPKAIGDTFFKRMYHHAIYKCVICNKDTYFLLCKVYLQNSGNRTFHEFPFSVPHQYPIPSVSSHLAILLSVRLATIEAEKCFFAGAYNACGVMTRRAIHCVCKDKGAKGKGLFDQLKNLRDEHVITPSLWEWAEEIRVAGKIGAHPEWGDLTREDAEHALKFLQETLKHVYVMPADLAAKRLKGNEHSRKNPS